MSSVEENLFFRSMESKDVDTFFDNLKATKPSFSNCPAVDRNRFDAYYQNTYGRSGSVVWLARKISHLVLIFWDGIIENVMNIFKLFIQSMLLLGSKAYHSRCFTKTLSHQSSVYISEKINSLLVMVYNIGQNFMVAFGHSHSIINDKEGRFTIDQASLEKHGYTYRHFHEEATVTGILDQEKLELHGKYFHNLLRMNGFGQEKIDNLAATLIKLKKFDKSYLKYKKWLASVIMLKGLNKNFDIMELQKRLEIANRLCIKLPDDMAGDFIYFITRHVINYYFDPITQTLDEENKYQVLETILLFINKIKDECFFCFVSENIFGAFLDTGFYQCTEFRKNLLLNNEKELLKVFLKINPKNFMGFLFANQSKDIFTFQQGILKVETKGADWSERQRFLRETVNEIKKDNALYFFEYLLYKQTYVNHILKCLSIGGHRYFKKKTQAHVFARKLIVDICLQKDIKLFLETYIKEAKETALVIDGLNFVEFATALSSESAMKIWNTLNTNFLFIQQAVHDDRILLLKSMVAYSTEFNKKAMTILCCFKYINARKEYPSTLAVNHHWKSYALIFSNFLNPHSQLTELRGERTKGDNCKSPFSRATP